MMFKQIELLENVPIVHILNKYTGLTKGYPSF